MMVLEKYDRWIDIFSDLVSLKILFYLRDFNPNVLATVLEKEFGIGRNQLDKKINELIEAGLVKVASESPIGFSLTPYGRIGTDRALKLVD